MLNPEVIESVAQCIATAAHTPVKVILFGSYARGTADQGSDLDFLVVEQEIPDPMNEYLKLHRAASGFGVGVDIVLMTESEFEKNATGGLPRPIPPREKEKCSMNAHKEQAVGLIVAGKRDALTIRLLNQTGRAPHESIGFHAQQACEKFIKAILVLNGIVFERTHDLILLHGLALQHEITIPADIEKLRALNSYAVQFRYEGCPVEMIARQNARPLPLSWRIGQIPSLKSHDPLRRSPHESMVRCHCF